MTPAIKLLRQCLCKWTFNYFILEEQFPDFCQDEIKLVADF